MASTPNTNLRVDHLGEVAVLVADLALPALGIRLQDAAVTTSLPPGVPTEMDAATRMRQELPPAAAESGDGAAA